MCGSTIERELEPEPGYVVKTTTQLWCPQRMSRADEGLDEESHGSLKGALYYFISFCRAKRAAARAAFTVDDAASFYARILHSPFPPLGGKNVARSRTHRSLLGLFVDVALLCVRDNEGTLPRVLLWLAVFPLCNF